MFKIYLYKKINTISYGLTNGAYQWLLDHNEDQCVILAGHSNSGKTETARLIVHFLTQVAAARRSVAFVETPLISQQHFHPLARPKSTGCVPATLSRSKAAKGGLLKKQRSVDIDKVKVGILISILHILFIFYF